MRFSLAPVSIDTVPISGTYDPFKIFVDDGTHSDARSSTCFLFGAKTTIWFDQRTCSLFERGPDKASTGSLVGEVCHVSRTRPEFGATVSAVLDP